VSFADTDLYAETHNGYGDPICVVHSLSDSILMLDRLRQAVHAPYRALIPGNTTTRPRLVLYGVARTKALAQLAPAAQFPTPVERMMYERNQWNNTAGVNHHKQFFEGGQRAR
jgi:hypothetical protein